MKKDIKNQTLNDTVNTLKSSEELITRKEAIQKTAKFMAVTALATFIILNPKKAQAQSGGPGGPGF